MSAEYKVTKGIYMRKYQAKNIWEVGGACLEKQRKICTTHGLCECCTSVARVLHKLRTIKGVVRVSHKVRTTEGVVRISHKPGAVVFQRPYIPHFSFKLYTVRSVGFLLPEI